MASLRSITSSASGCSIDGTMREVAVLKPQGRRTTRILTDVLILLSSGLLVVSLTGRFPFSGAYPSPIGVLKIGPRPTIWVVFLAVSLLTRITLRQEGGCFTGLFTHPTPTRLFLIALFIYNANGAQHGAVDTIPTRFLPYSILKEQNFDLDEFRFLYAHGVPAYLIQSGNHLISAYPPGPAILALPFYLLPVLSGVPPDSKLVTDVEKLAASVLTALSVVLVYLTLRRLGGEKTAFKLSLLYALGTSALSVSSQALWQHGPSQLLLAASLYCLVRGMEQVKWVAFSGLMLGSAVLCRPTDVLVASALAIYVLHTHRREACLFTLLALPPIAFFLLYNHWHFGSATRIGYDQGFFSGGMWNIPFFSGLAGILLSPSRGLFIYSPVFLFSLVGMCIVWRHSGNFLYKYVSMAIVSVIVLYSKWGIWWGGWTFGPRLLADVTPLLTIMLLPAFQRIEPRPALRMAFYTLAAISIVIHVLGAFTPGNWNPDIGEPSHRLWSWSDGQLINSVRTLLSKVTGRYILIDAPGVRIAVDKTSYRVGEEAGIILTLDAGRHPIAFDGYMEVFHDAKRLGFLGPQGMSSPPSPFIVSRQTPGSEEVKLFLRIPPDAPPGTYRLRGLLCKPRTLPECVDGKRDRLFESQAVMLTVSR